MQRRRNERIKAIAKESIRSYLNSRSLILVLITIFLGISVFYLLFISKRSFINYSKPETTFVPQDSLLRLEDSISSTNRMVEMLDTAINKELLVEGPIIKRQEQGQVSEFNKQLLIKKIDAILRYLKTPLTQFNQLPLYFINNAELEQQIKAYNAEQVKVAKEYQSKSRYDNSFFNSLESLQVTLIEKLNAERTMLAQRNRTQKTVVKGTQKTSKKLSELLHSRDSILSVYAEQLERYQKRLDKVTGGRLLDPSTFRSKPTTKMAETISYQENNRSYNWLLIIPLALVAASVPFFISLFKKYTSPFIQRLEDIEMSSSEKFIELVLNKNVNEELIAFNYEQLVKKVKRLKRSKHALIAFYSAGAEDQRQIISKQLGVLLSKLGNLVLHIDLINQSDNNYPCENTYNLSDFIKHAAAIEEALLKTTGHQPYHQLNIVVDNELIEQEDHATYNLKYFWTLQHYLTKTALKKNLGAFKKHFDYVIINTPDFVQLDSSLLYVPSKNINIQVFKAGTTTRASANLLCKLNANESTPIINIIDFSGVG